jgi:SAM-dependent methyltransferase
MVAGPGELARAYGPDMYDTMASVGRSSAEVIVPLVCEHMRPHSVVDYGCGTGEWLAVFREFGAEEVLGVDGPWVDRQQLAIPAEAYQAHDLGQPFVAGREFDLAICLEVAGHIPPEREDAFVDSLVALAPAILFSAPIPHQRGVGEGPWNNRWPAHWAARFAERGLVAVDCLRLRVWEDPRVEWWYAQNIWLAVRREKLADLSSMPQEAERGRAAPLSLVHPEVLEQVANPNLRPLILERLKRRGLRDLVASKLRGRLSRADQS